MANKGQFNKTLEWDVCSVNSDTSLIVIDLCPKQDAPTESTTDPIEMETDKCKTEVHDQVEGPSSGIRDNHAGGMKENDSNDPGRGSTDKQPKLEGTCNSPCKDVDAKGSVCVSSCPNFSPQFEIDDVIDDCPRTLAPKKETSPISLGLSGDVCNENGVIITQTSEPVDCLVIDLEGDMDKDSDKPLVKELRRVFEDSDKSDKLDENRVEPAESVTVASHDNAAFEADGITNDNDGSSAKHSYDETDRHALDPGVSDALVGSSSSSPSMGIANVTSKDPGTSGVSVDDIQDKASSGNKGRIPLHTYENVAPPVHGYENVILESRAPESQVHPSGGDDTPMAEQNERSDTLVELKHSMPLDKSSSEIEQADHSSQPSSPTKKRVSFYDNAPESGHSRIRYCRSISAKSADSNSSDYRDPVLWHAVAPPTHSSTPQKSTNHITASHDQNDVTLDVNGDASMLEESSQDILSAAKPFNDSGEPLVNVSVGSHSGASYSTNGKAEKSAIEDNPVAAVDSADEDKWLEWAKKQFRDAKGGNKQLSFKEFKKALNIRGSFFAGRFFDQFDKNKDGHVDPDDMVSTLVRITKGKSVDKIRFLFDIYDVNGNGTIDPEELKTVLKACMQESNLSLSEGCLERLTLALFDEADTNHNGAITFDDLVSVLEQYPEVMSNLSISAANWLKPWTSPNRKASEQKSCCSCPTSNKICSQKFIQNNISTLVAIILYIIINVALFATCIRYADNNWCVIIARGCGMCLNFNCALIVMFMLRRTITWLRSGKAKGYLPLDDCISFHKWVGVAILVFSLVHTAAHLGNIAYVRATPLPNNSTSHLEFWEYLFTLRSQVGFVGPGFGFLSGVICQVILLVMCICAMPCIRRNGYFEVFYWTHLLYVLFYVFLITHGPIFYIFFLIPGAMFIVEKVGITLIASRAKYGTLYIERVNILPSKVTHLIIKRPNNFLYRPGDWIFIRIPAIARFEWHPFTISSNPERRDELWLHVRSAGHWTNRLHEYFENYEQLADKPPGEHPDVETGSHTPQSELKNSQSNNNHELQRSPVKKKISLDITTLETPMRRIATMPAHNAALQCHPKSNLAKSVSHKLQHSASVNQRALEIIEMWRKRHSTKHVQVMCSIDGPYGTPTREIFDTEHAVLIGAGIGVTPMASILQSIMYRYKKLRRTCPKCHHNWYGEMPETVMKLKKVNFIWINRQQHAFEWFLNMLTQLEIEQESTDDSEFGKFLEMEMYMTGAASMTDIKGLGLQVALELIHKKQNKDLLTGLHTRTKPGRPNWRKVFDQIDENKKGKVKVFFCGAPMIANILKDNCSKRGYEFVQEVF